VQGLGQQPDGKAEKRAGSQDTPCEAYGLMPVHASPPTRPRELTDMPSSSYSTISSDSSGWTCCGAEGKGARGGGPGRRPGTLSISAASRSARSRAKVTCSR
jgi:hypothetical protein